MVTFLTIWFKFLRIFKFIGIADIVALIQLPMFVVTFGLYYLESQLFELLKLYFTKFIFQR